MDVTVMEYMLKLAEEKNLTRAAEHFYISPSALSQRLAREEEETGCILFERKDGGFVPTRKGEIYLRYAREIVAAKEETYQQIAKLSSHFFALRIVSSYQFFQSVSEEILPELRRLFPGARFDLQPADSYIVRHCLLNGLADIGLLCLSAAGDSLLEQEVLGMDRLTAAVPESLLPSGQELSLNTLKTLPFILLQEGSSFRSMENEILYEHELYPATVYEAESFLLVRDLLRAGIGAAFLPESMTETLQGCRIFPLDPPKAYYRILAYPKYKELGAEGKAARELALSFFRGRKTE